MWIRSYSIEKVCLITILLTFFLGCRDEPQVLRAKIVERQDELIGGPAARGRVGDFLIENDKVRFIISGTGPSYAAGTFGGSITDVDLRRWRSDERNGKGHDAFAETFPLTNLLVTNPADPTRDLVLTEDGTPKLRPSVSQVSVVKDGSDGEAIIRVEGHSGYMFDSLKFLNQDFFTGFLAGGIGGIKFSVIDNLARNLFQVDLLGVIARLQTSFEFSTDYILREGDNYLTIRTEVRLSPSSEDMLAPCPAVTCDLTCDHGFAMEATTVEIAALETSGTRMCPVCECALSAKSMPTLNESRDIFSVILGGLESWQDPSWRGGVISGDFIFFGGSCDIFSPGIGFDYDQKIFENMWQGIGTLGSPFALDFIAGTADSVSYALTSRNPNRREGFECPAHRLAITSAPNASEEMLAQTLELNYGFHPSVAKISAKTLIVDHKPIFIKTYTANPDDDPGTSVSETVRFAAFSAWKNKLLESDDVIAIRNQLGDGITLDIIPQHDCRPSKLLVPLFSTSATATLSHFSETDRLLDSGDGSLRDKTRTYTYERYFIVGEGDVGSLLGTVYSLRRTKPGHIKGIVTEEISGNPVYHADVYIVRDPRQSASEPLPTDLHSYHDQALRTFGDAGFVSQMQTDVGTDPVHDGDYRGPVEAGRYLLFAYDKARGMSPFMPIEVTEGSEHIVHLRLPRPGRVHYQVTDSGGNLMPAMITFRTLGADGEPLEWEGVNLPALGDPRWDHGITDLVHTASGEGEVSLPPGRYQVVVSRGFEYGLYIIEDFVVRSGQSLSIEAALVHEVDTRNHVSGDFHVHAQPSTDSGLSLDLRVRAAAAQGLEMAIATDHDVVTDYSPYIKALGLERFVVSQTGAETSPLEYGHYNAWPLTYDERKGPTHDAPPWAGMPLVDIWGSMRDRADEPDAFVLQNNHARDGFLGYFSQIGMRTYDLERKTPGLEMCNAVFEEAPCDFGALELMNGKHFEYLWTPTIRETVAFNECYQEIVAATSTKQFLLGEDSVEPVCAALQRGPDECDGAEDRAKEADLTDEERTLRIRHRDHCRWHARFRRDMARCNDESMRLSDCKRHAMEGSKNLMVRYMLERTPAEHAALVATTSETDLGCDGEKAMVGCDARINEAGEYLAGCGGSDKCFCQSCVCEQHPECCQKPTDGGTGWTEACATSCENECNGCGLQPCTERFQPFDDWFAFLNAGMKVTATANSDSHSIESQIGLPRNYVQLGTDQPLSVDRNTYNQAINAHRVVLSSGPFIDFQLRHGDHAYRVGDTFDATDGTAVSAYIRVQTASWFRVDRIEIYRNGQLEKPFFIEPEGGDEEAARQRITDFEETFELERPEEDSWYVVLAYGLNDESPMAPVYKRRPYGHILLTTVIALGADQILANFSSLLEKLPASLTGGIALEPLELPDSVDIFPLALTNPIWVDYDGLGFKAPNAIDLDGDGQADLPPFCSRDCVPSLDADGRDTQSTCGENQVCVTDPETGLGRCRIPIPEYCVGLQPIGGQ